MAYREQKAAEKKAAAEKDAETEDAKAKVRREKARQELETRVEQAFLDAGGTAREYLRLKKTVVEAALIAVATQPADDTDKDTSDTPKAEPPLTKRQYLDR
jgi:hypothetical protein